MKTNQSLVVALDADTPQKNLDVVCAMQGVPRIGGFKIGFGLSLAGLRAQARIIRSAYCDDTTLIYDHQKGGTDIPETGALFAKTVKSAGVDAAIMFPLTGPESQQEWTRACFDVDLRPILGLAMTHKRFFVSEGGYISDDAPERAFRMGAQQGIRDFVVPGTKLNWVIKLRGILTEELGEDGFVLYAPGFISQGGDITECGKAAGQNFHPIVGSAIYTKPNRDAMRSAAIDATSKLAA
jgi:orotidine-5'-phosphate decarboxylase